MTFFMVVLGSVLFLAIGNVFQKKGHLKRDSAHGIFHHPVSGLLLNQYWLLGICGAIGGTLLYNFALVNPHWSITVIQPVMALNPVFTAIFAFIFLKERLSRASLESTIIVIVGVILLGFVVGEEIVLFNELRTNVCIGILCASIVPILLMKDREHKYAILSGIAFGLAAVLLKASSYTVPVEQFDALKLNSVTSIWHYLVNLVALYYLWLYGVIFFAGFLFFQLGFAHGRATIIVAYSASIGVLVPVVVGFIAFGERVGVLKIVGIVIIVLGILRPLLNSRLEPVQH